MSMLFPDGSLSNQPDLVGVPAGSISTNAPTVSMENTTDRKRGRLSPLSQAQVNAVRARFPDFEEQILKHKLHLGKPAAHGTRARDPERLAAWINTTVQEIMESPAFDIINDTATQVRRTIKEMFKNYCNNTFIKRNKAAMVQEAIANKTDTPTVSTMEASKAADALISFKTPAAAKEIFREQHLEEIRQESVRLRAEAAEARKAAGVGPEDFDPRRDDNGGAFFQKALSDLWQKADQEHYKKMVNNDRFVNQQKFNAAMKTALATICQSGALGPMEIVLLSGFRNKEDQVEFSILNAHHIDPADGMPPPPFLQGDKEKNNMEMLVEWWRDYCQLHIPSNITERPTIPENPYIMYNNGIPVLAEIDLTKCTPFDLASLMKEFLIKLWEFSWPKDQVRASIPLLEMQSHPDDFYDTRKYTFPVPLSVIESTQVPDLWALATYLLQICARSCSTPFTFRSKEDIEMRTASRSREEELVQTTGQEIVMTDIEAPTANSPSNPNTWELRPDLGSLIANADNSNTNNVVSNPNLPSHPTAWGLGCDFPPSVPEANVSSEHPPLSWVVHSDFPSNIPNADVSSDPNAWNTPFDFHSLGSDGNSPSNRLSTVWDDQSDFLAGPNVNTPSVPDVPNTNHSTNSMPIAWKVNEHLSQASQSSQPPQVMQSFLSPQPLQRMQAIQHSQDIQPSQPMQPMHTSSQLTKNAPSIPNPSQPFLQSPQPSQLVRSFLSPQPSQPMQVIQHSQAIQPSQPTQSMHTPQLTKNTPPIPSPLRPSSQPSSQLPQPSQLVRSPHPSQPMQVIQHSQAILPFQPMQPMQTSQLTKNVPPTPSPLQPSSQSLQQFSHPLQSSQPSELMRSSLSPNTSQLTENMPPISSLQSTPSLQPPHPSQSMSLLQFTPSSQFSQPDKHCNSQPHLFTAGSLDQARSSMEDNSSPSCPSNPSACAPAPLPVQETHRRGGRRGKRNTPAVNEGVRKSSRARPGKRTNPDPVPQQDNAKKPKVKKSHYGYLVRQPDGTAVMADENNNIYGYVRTNADGDPYVVDGNGCFLENVPKATFAEMLTQTGKCF
ncbi:hypothetical protein FB446DRAFT_804558 [Lentinula raphanica]|nr:hypothetical protein FB446DRAFT_804558 [Lentinula raphanica]